MATYLTHTPSGNNRQIFTLSAWVKIVTIDSKFVYTAQEIHQLIFLV